MKVSVFSAKDHDEHFLNAANANARHEFDYISGRLSAASARLAAGSRAVCLFSTDRADESTISQLSALGVELIALRSAGFDNVDIAAATEYGMSVCRVPAYSPNAVAEHAFALLLSLVRKIHFASERVRRGDLRLDGLLGFDLAGKTIGIIGLGNIGSVAAKIANGFGCSVLASDPIVRSDCSDIVEYADLASLLERADIVSLHCPLNHSTHRLIDAEALARMKPGALLVNTSRGAVVDTRAVLDALESDQLAGLATDVYEHEAGLFFEDHSGEPPVDRLFARLIAHPNVLVTPHQGFFTVEALTNIAATTIANLDSFELTGSVSNRVGS